jgi:hypothetical protein
MSEWTPEYGEVQCAVRAETRLLYIVSKIVCGAEDYCKWMLYVEELDNGEEVYHCILEFQTAVYPS